MNTYDRQIIGTLANKEDTNGKNSVFLNRSSAIQYMVKSLILPIETSNLFTGYMSSFEDDVDFDDEYLPDEQRIQKFMDGVSNQLFVFSYRPNYDGEYPKLQKVNLVPKPNSFDNNTLFYEVPVFSASNDELINEWEETHRWRLYRDYNNLSEFKKFIEEKKSVGRIYGYDADEFKTSFVIWKDEEGKLFAIGKITDSHYNTLGGLMLEGNDLFKIDISEYIKFVVYSIYTNPTIMFVPDSIYKNIEDTILKATVSIEKDNLSDIEKEKGTVTSVENSIEEKNEILEINERSKEKLIEIDTSIKNDRLIIESMDYHSQKKNLYYSMRDFVNIHTAIKCSNLVILSGLSGTGKSQLVEIYARALGINPSANPDDNRLLIIPVRPSWNDDADLLGYVDLVHMVYRASDTGFVDFLVNAQKDDNKNKMYIVCFDEMNLARVEHYFSQFLSILERSVNQRQLQLYDNQYLGRLYNSREYPDRITIGDNIKFIGTVNVDESTYHFSDKVLDRANVIQLDVLNYAEEWKNKPYANFSNPVWTKDDYSSLIAKNTEKNMQRIHELLWKIHQLMQSASTKYGVGPRVVKSIESYLCNLPEPRIDEFDERIALDYQIVQRVLTKVRGPESQLGDILAKNSENNFYKLFEEYKDLSDFERCQSAIAQKQKELETYGYCI